MAKEKREKTRRLAESSLYLLTPPDIIDPGILVPMVVEVVRAGADIIQFRNKTGTTRELIETGGALCEAVHREGALFLVNDRADVALATGADGVHLGQEDLPLSWARRIIGREHGGIIGISTHSIEQALRAEAEGADYVGFGPVFPTPAKSGYAPIGTAHFAVLNKRLRIPCFAIGGIYSGNVGQVREAGVRRVAVCNGVFGQGDVAGATALIKQRLHSPSPP